MTNAASAVACHATLENLKIVLPPKKPATFLSPGGEFRRQRLVYFSFFDLVVVFVCAIIFLRSTSDCLPNV